MHYPFESPLNPPVGDLVNRYKTANPLLYGILKEKALDHRKHQTNAEALLWESLKSKQLDGFKFRRQHIIDDMIVDFVCLSKRLVIEVDGGYHNEPQTKELDKLKTDILEAVGYRVVRFTNEEVIGNHEEVLKKIKSALKSPPRGDLGGFFPADFIAEGVDQTRGWFFTLHAISTMIKGSVAFKNIISNGLVLDANGNKMSKRLGNAVDPFATIEKYGSDPLRWYMITNSQPWDNLKFDIAGVEEVRRKFFGTLYNTYSFFSLYANIDGFTYSEAEVPADQRPELDQWVLSLLNTLVKEVTDAYESYEPTRAGRAIAEFVSENLSNWYVRLSRKRFWGGSYDTDKISAYQTLYTCLETIAKLAAPIAPFYTDQLYRDLNKVSGREEDMSVHLTRFPTANEALINRSLEERMDIAQRISSMILSLRRKEKLKVRQPLAKIIVPVLNDNFRKQFEAVESIILTEVNVKEVEYLTDSEGIIKKKIKPNFKTLGPKYGKLMKQIAAFVTQMNQHDIATFERNGCFAATIEGESVELSPEDVEIISEDIPGWQVASEGALTVALDINVTPELRMEGIAREFINRIQNIRKESDFEVTDKIKLTIVRHPDLNESLERHSDYICNQTLALQLLLVDTIDNPAARAIEIDKGVETIMLVEKVY
jgi:Isoleucyl-tRNA synthetase (EC 6.1.1.5)